MTAEEILWEIQKVKKNHEKEKKSLVDLTYEAEEIEKKVNDKILLIKELEKKYVELNQKLLDINERRQ